MKTTIKLVAAVCACFIIVTIGSYVIVAQSAITGTWTANNYNWNRKKKDSTKSRDTHIQLSFRYEITKNGKTHNNQHGSTYAFDRISGLTKAQTEGSSSEVSFRIVREAGTIECQGVFRNGKGIGEFRFVPNKSFADSMKSKGFELSDSRMFSAASLDLKMADVDDLMSAGFQNLTVKDVFKAKIFKVNSAYKREMASAGFPNLTMKELVKARIFKVDSAFVKSAYEMGVAQNAFNDIVKLKIHKVSPEYLQKMRAAGFPNLKAREAVRLRIFKITPEFVSEMNGLGFSNLSVSDATKLKIHKVTPAFIKEMRDQGYTNLSVRDATRLRIHKIDGAFVKKAKAESTGPLTVRDLVRLKIRKRITNKRVTR